MKAMFVESTRCVPYARAIVQAYKPLETRGKNMLSALVGERVAVVETGRGKKPMVVGYVTVTKAERLGVFWLDTHRNLTLIPEGSRYDSHGKCKWGYWLSDPEECEPYPLPSSAVRHGRSWCEF